MNGFDFFKDHHTDKELVHSLRGKELHVLSRLRAIVSSGANLSRILQHHDEVDLAFISAFRTGEDPESGGYGFYEEGEKDSLGIAHKKGEKVSHKENRRNNKTLADGIRSAGYGFIQIKGMYDAPEESFCVVNTVEDTDRFALRMSSLAKDFGQDSVLIAPKGDVPYYFYAKDGRKEYFSDASIEVLKDAVTNFFSQIKSHKFRFNMSYAVVVDGPGKADSLSPIRSGMETLIPLGVRKRLDSSLLVGSPRRLTIRQRYMFMDTRG